MVVLLFWQGAGGQNLVRIDAHNQVDDFLVGDFAEPVRRVRRNDDDVTGTDFAAHTILNTDAFCTGPIEDLTTSLFGGTSLGSLSMPPVTSVPLPEITW